MVDDPRGGVVDERQERRKERRVGARLVDGGGCRGDQLGIIEQPPRGCRQLGEVLGLGVQRVVEGCGDAVRLRPPRV
jgi:hypothetical protein